MKKSARFIALIFSAAFGMTASAQLINYNYRDYIPETNPAPLYASPGAGADKAKAGYSLVWSEEFDYGSDAALRTSLATNWNYSSGATMGTYYGSSTDQNTHIYSVGTDHTGCSAMSISLDKLSTPVVYNSVSYDYGSAFLMSKKHFTYGYYEARCKLKEGRGGPVTIELVNLQGETLEKISSDGASQVQLDMEKYPAGIYLVRMYNDAEVATARLIRE